MKKLFVRTLYPDDCPSHHSPERTTVPRLKLYTLVLSAIFREKGTPGMVRAIPGACAAVSVSLAIDEGVSAAKRLFPVQEGWSEHNAVAIEIPSHLIEEVYTQEVMNVST